MRALNATRVPEALGRRSKDQAGTLNQHRDGSTYGRLTRHAAGCPDARGMFHLRKAVETKIGEHRTAQARESYQRVLFGPSPTPIEVSPEFCLSLDEDMYSPNSDYEGTFVFQKHHFRRIGELKGEGEEFECAVFLDSLREVRSWVRNLSRPNSAFWLQTSTDRFYPDFVALLDDGRWLVVEAKGEHLWSNDDSKEKRAVGELWADKSDGRCLFVMPKGSDWNAIHAVL